MRGKSPDSMLQSTVSHVRLALSALGCVVLSASLFNWTQALQTARPQYTWVDANASSAPPLDTAETWQVSGSCVRPYFVRAALRSKAKLKVYYDIAPEAVRARLSRTPDIPQPTGSKNWYRLVKNQPDSQSANTDDLEFGALLHVEYAEWYANVFKLEVDASRWQQRLVDVTDQRLMLSESARKSFRAYSARDAGAADATSGFDSQVLATLGLGGFPEDEEQSLKTDCVKVGLMHKVLTRPNYLEELWRWPVEQTAMFALAFELILLAVFLVPMTLWIGTGDAQLAAQHVREAAGRLGGKVRGFDWKKRVSMAKGRFQAICTAARTSLGELGARLKPIAENQIVLFLRWVVLPSIALGVLLGERCAALLRRHAGLQNTGHGLDFVARVLRQTSADRTA
jgi:hypothetical protein